MARRRVTGLLGDRFTNLLGGSGPGIGPVGDSIGADEPCENVIDWQSGPVLERKLPCWDNGRIDRRLIHEPVEDIESRVISTAAGSAESQCRDDACLRRLPLGGVNWELCVCCWPMGLVAGRPDLDISDKGGISLSGFSLMHGTRLAGLVPGRGRVAALLSRERLGPPAYSV